MNNDGYAGLGKRGYEHFAVAECGDPEVAEQYLPIIHLVFANLKTWLIGIHHGVSRSVRRFVLGPFCQTLTNLSPKKTANCVLASNHSRGGRFHASAA